MSRPLALAAALPAVLLFVAAAETAAYRNQTEELQTVVRECAEVATSLPDQQELAFRRLVEQSLEASGIDEGAVVTTSIEGEGSARRLEAAVTVNWGGLTGLFPAPETVHYSATRRLGSSGT